MEGFLLINRDLNGLGQPEQPKDITWKNLSLCFKVRLKAYKLRK